MRLNPKEQEKLMLHMAGNKEIFFFQTPLSALSYFISRIITGVFYLVMNFFYFFDCFFHVQQRKNHRKQRKEGKMQKKTKKIL